MASGIRLPLEIRAAFASVRKAQIPALMLAYINILLVTVRTRAEGVHTCLRICGPCRLCYLLFFRAGRRLAKCGHRRQRVHVVPPMYDLAVFDSNYRDEPVVVGGAARDYLAVYLVFDDDDAWVLRSVNDECVCAMQDDVLAVSCVERHERLTTIHCGGPTWENISKLEYRIVGNGIKIVVAVDKTGQPPL